MRSRRDFMKLGLAVGAAGLLPRWVNADGNVFSSSGNQPFPSPYLQPFVTELPIPPAIRPLDPFATQRSVPFGTQYHIINIREGLHSFHPQLPPTPVWGYDGVSTNGNLLTPGPTLVTRVGQPTLVRFQNQLPANHRGFGAPNMSIHRHGGFQESQDDGYPLDLFGPGQVSRLLLPRDPGRGPARDAEHAVVPRSLHRFHGAQCVSRPGRVQRAVRRR